MPRGIGDIPELRLRTMTRFIEKFKSPPELVLSNLFGSTDSVSSSIKWESQEGSRGMAPFSPPGAPAQQTSPHGIAQHIAEAAFWKEKMYFDEEFLNNLRKEGTESEYLAARKRLSREMGGLVNRNLRRKEWMFAKMMFENGFAYSTKGGTKITIDYGIPTANIVSLSANYKWSTGTSRDILGDIIDGKRVISEACGGKANFAICNSYILEYIAQDPAILTLLQKSTFGQGDLFSGNRNSIVGVNPRVLGSLLDIDNFMIYDELFEARAWLTAVVTGGSTVAVSVDDASDFVAGGTLTFHDVSAGTTEGETISSVDEQAGTVTVSTAPTASFRASEDYVSMVKRFVPDTLFTMFASTVEGQTIAEYFRAPYSIPRTYGLKTDSKEEWDPEGVWIRAQDKGLPVLYNRDAVYNLTVA